jgi:hypothetical protein
VNKNFIPIVFIRCTNWGLSIGFAEQIAQADAKNRAA